MTRQGRGVTVAAALSGLVAALTLGAGGPSPAAGAVPSDAAPSVRLAGPTPTLPTGSAVVGPSDASTQVTADVALQAP